MDAEQVMSKALEGQFWGWDQNQRLCNLSAPKLGPEERDARNQRRRKEKLDSILDSVKPKTRVSFERDYVLTCQVIVKAVSLVTNISVGALTGVTRCAVVVHARQAAMWLCKDLIGASFPQIGRAVGNRDHSTVHHGCARVAADMPRFQHIISGVKAIISVDENGGFVLNVPPETIRAEGVLSAPATALTK